MLLPRLTFLTFHGLGEPPHSVPDAERPYWLPVPVFADTLRVLADLAMPAGMELRITIDDGNASDLAHAVPLLLEHGMSAEIFVPTGRIGRPGSLARSDILEIDRLGCPIGSHGIEHVPWAGLDDRELDRELNESKALLEDILGHAIDGAAAPFSSFDARVVAHAKAAGYRRIHMGRGGFTWSGQGLVPRLSARTGFEPRRDIPHLLAFKRRLRSAVADPLRRLKYNSVALERPHA
jgi:peptidoglycan/xylan/chitin deacetylase (PgdA/CDA1 family)